jgi:DNA-binding SARP family transcriptional activator/tetratricopeptide (TPR) repeat protein
MEIVLLGRNKAATAVAFARYAMGLVLPECLPELVWGMEFKVLGPPKILVAGPRGVTVSPQLWNVLVSLLLAPGVCVPAEVLVDRLWGDNPPPKARTTLRSYVWRIDRAMAQAGEDAIQVSRQARGYALDVAPDAVDLHRFRSLKRQSDALAESGESRHAAVLLREAEAIWRGRALAGLPGDWVGRVRDGLEEELRAVTARRIELELVLGRHTELLAELGELTERHPLDEALAAHRMVALFRSGRQADALRVYRETRARLVAEGVAPAPGLAQLQQRILRQDAGLGMTSANPRTGRELHPDTLPADVADFTGRLEELRLLTEETRLGSGPVLWIIEGMSGAGKTSLAVHAGHAMAERYPDAQLYLNFRAHDQLRDPLDPADAARDLLTTLTPTARVPDTLRARIERWRAAFADRRAVIIFDDVTGPEQIAPLLPQAGDGLIIVTSRRRQRDWRDWAQARVLPLPVLSEDDAMTLFARIAGRLGDGEPDLLARVARLCGYLPLAIRVAASRLRSSDGSALPDLLEELEEPGARQENAGGLSHQIQAAFELSYRRLSPGEQRFFRYLGISPCLGISPDSAAVLSGGTRPEAQAALDVLSSHHLLEEVTQGRFGFHDLIRAFAAARFAREDPEPELRRAVGRLADYYIRTVRRANEVLGDSSRADHEPPTPFKETPEGAQAWLETEWGNAVRIARYCASHEWKRRCADLIHELGEFLETSGHWDEALAADLTALDACRDLDDLPRIARAAFALSLTSLLTGKSDSALQHATEAAAAFGTLGDRRGRAAALDRLGTIHHHAARFREALAYHQEAMDIYRATDDPCGLALALVHAGTALWSLGRQAEQMSYLAEALDIYHRSGDLRGQAKTLNNIGSVQFGQGYHRDAMRSYQASLDIFRKIGGKQNIALLKHNMGRVYQYKGDCRAAIVIYREVLATYRSIGDLQHQAHALTDIGSVYQWMDRFDEAITHHEKAAELSEITGDRYVYVKALCGIAEAHFGAGRHGVALENYERAIRLSGEIDSLYLKAKALTGIAEITLRTRGPEAARICWREAYDIFAQLGVPEAAIMEIRLQTLDATVS